MMRLARPCLEPGCPVPAPSGARCPRHATLRTGETARRDIQHRGTATDRGYDRAWLKLRVAFAWAHPLCVAHLALGRVVPVAIVDHIVALRDGGGRLDSTNLQSLCRPCHAAKTARELRARRGIAGRVSSGPPPSDTGPVAGVNPVRVARMRLA